jgi:competence protein ComGC
MNSKRSSKNSETAFNLAELAVLIACAGVLALLVFPALATGKIQSASFGCLYNLLHLQAGCAIYASENNDYLVPNAPYGYPAILASCNGTSATSHQ